MVVSSKFRAHPSPSLYIALLHARMELESHFHWKFDIFIARPAALADAKIMAIEYKLAAGGGAFTNGFQAER